MIVNFSHEMVVELDFNNRWQDFEEYVLKIVQSFDIEVEFRKVFSNTDRKFEIDVVAYFNDFCICIDCKLYGAIRYRKSSLKKEAIKHAYRCGEFEKSVEWSCVPVLVTLLDDGVNFESGCLIIPYHKFNYFLCNVDSFIDI